MSYRNGRSYSDFRGLNLQAGNGLIRFEIPSVDPTTTTGEYILHLNSDGALVFNNGTTATVIGAAGSVTSSTWDGIYAADKTLNISGTTLTFDGNHASNNVLTIQNTGAGTGHLLQITNTGTGMDINGTSDSWSVSAAGVAILEELTIDGTEGSNIFTVTKGDTRFLDGAVAITDDDNAASFTVTNNTATTASVAVFVGSGAFTGNTTSSWMTITPSGLTTGTAVYLPVAALTTGKALHIVANAVTDGLVVNITSSSTVHTATGRLLNIASTAATNTSAVLNEIATAANDETILLRLTASDLLAAGRILDFSASSMTTGTAIYAGALDGLTTGIGISIASTSTGMTTGSLARFSTGTTGAVATNGIVSIRGTGAHTSTSNVGLLDVQSSGATGAATIVNIKSTAAAQTDTTLLNVEASGFTTGYTGSMVRIKSVTTTGACKVVDILADGITSGGTAVDLSVDALTTGIGLNIANSAGAMTTGSLLRIAAQGTGAIATNGIVSFTHTGNFTSTSAVDGGFVEIKANDTTAGTVFNLVADALTTGIGMQLSNATSAMTSGSLLRITASGTGTVATNGIVSITHGGIFVSTSNAGVLDVRATAMVGTASNGTLVNFMTTAAAQVDTTVLNVENSGFTTGYTGTMLRVKSPSTTGACKVVGIIADGMTSAGVGLHISAAALAAGGMGISVDITAATAGNLLNLITTGAYTGTGMALITAGAMTTGICLSIISTTGLTTGSLIRATSSTAGAINTNGAISFSATGAFTSTDRNGFVNVLANTTTAGTVTHIIGTALTTGTLLSLEAVEATLSSGLYIQCYDGAANDFSVARYGATVIAGNASGTASLTLTAGDFVMSAGVLRQAVTATITADVGSVQGGSALTRGINEVAVCANAGDAVTLPTAAAGQTVYIVNHGAQSCDVFPASGDAINEAAANAAKALAADAAMICFSYDSTNWECNTLAR